MTNMLEHHELFASKNVLPRHVDVWLPPSYGSDPQRHYGVLYMHDGQNLFDPNIAYGDIDWGVIPALTQLYWAGAVQEVIVVGIWNTEKRWREYLPQRPFNTDQGQTVLSKLAAEYRDDPHRNLDEGPNSDAYLRFIVEELKPFIDAQYRTRPGREDTFIMGSSMGGLISLYALCQYPYLFAGAGCLSTHWPAAPGVMADYLQQQLPPPGQHRLYFDYGTETLDAEYEPHQNEVDQIMRQAGYQLGKDWLTQRFEGADHSESSWRQRIHIPLEFLLHEN